MTESRMRLDYPGCRQVLLARLDEPAPGRIQILTGPRQVGKTTLLLELARHFGSAAVYRAGDEPAASLSGHWERSWLEAEQRASESRAVLLLDEVQHFAGWSARLKGRWDRLRRSGIPLHVVVSGSSALRIGGGSKESLAGRFERVELAHWSASSLAGAFDIPPREAVMALIRWGSYPGAFPLRGDPARFRAYVRDAIIEPALSRDVLSLVEVRKPALLRQVFAIAADSTAQIVSLQKIQGRLADRGALETIAHYLDLLTDAGLVAALDKHSAAAHRRRAAPPKLVVLNNALLAAMHPGGAPEPDRDPARFGAWVENACLAHAWNAGQRVTWWREEPLEVDAVLEGSWGSWAVSISTGRLEIADLRGLAEFTRRSPRYRPLLVTAPGGEAEARASGMGAVSWVDFLAGGPSACEAG